MFLFLIFFFMKDMILKLFYIINKSFHCLSLRILGISYLSIVLFIVDQLFRFKFLHYFYNRSVLSSPCFCQKGKQKLLLILMVMSNLESYTLLVYSKHFCRFSLVKCKVTIFRWAPPLYVLLCVCVWVCLSRS